MTKPASTLNRDNIAAQRARYMSHAISHDEYYLWLAKDLGLGAWLVPVSRERLLQSKDPHFNDIPLAIWDRCDPHVRACLRIPAGGGSIGWSLSDTVCVLKALARESVEEGQ
jgi:hypothetical protein